MKIIIAGKDSYIGDAVAKRLKEDNHIVDCLDMRSDEWKEYDFSDVDVIFHCAALVHKNEKNHKYEEYKKVNVDLTYELARKAKSEGVKQFVFMSSRAVYGAENSCFHKVIVGKKTPLRPRTKYGKSKREAEKAIKPLHCNDFRIAIIRAPFIYGPGCRGNYQNLRKISLMMPVLPNIKNEYSMLYIGNLCELVAGIINKKLYGYFMPQDEPLHSTYNMMCLIKKYNGQKVVSTKLFNAPIIIGSVFIRKIRNAFGNATYDHCVSNCKCKYHKYPFEISVKNTEEYY